MPRDFFPRRESDILSWTSNFRSHVAADALSLGLSQAQAAEYAAAQELFAVLYGQSQTPSLRTVSITAAKNDARIALEAITRKLAGIIRAQPGVTGSMRIALGLALRDPGGGGARRHAPGDPPVLMVRAMQGRSVELRLSELTSGRACRPRGAQGVALLMFAGTGDEQPPQNLMKWTLAGQTSRCNARLQLPASLAGGTRVWLTAMWTGCRSEQSRPSAPVSVTVPHGAMAMIPSSKTSRRGGSLLLAA